MATLKMTEEERRIPVMQWDDASLGRMVKALVVVLYEKDDPEETPGAQNLNITASAAALIGEAIAAGSNESVLNIEGLVKDDQPLGDWEIVIRKKQENGHRLVPMDVDTIAEHCAFFYYWATEAFDDLVCTGTREERMGKMPRTMEERSASTRYAQRVRNHVIAVLADSTGADVAAAENLFKQATTHVYPDFVDDMKRLEDEVLLKVIAFDCFGTVFDTSSLTREQINDYVEHVNRADFSEYVFPQAWWDLPLHPDAEAGIRELQRKGYQCVTLSNGSAKLLRHVSERGGISWDNVINLAKHRVYKPHDQAYLTVQKETGVTPWQTLMVTANPAFGDLEGAFRVGMPAQVIRQTKDYNELPSVQNIVELAKQLRPRN